MNWENALKRARGKTLELLLLIGALALAVIITIYKVFPAEEIAYFSDVTTPLVIIAAVILLISGIKYKKRRDV